MLYNYYYKKNKYKKEFTVSHLTPIILALFATMGLSYSHNCAPSHSQPIDIEVEGDDKVTIDDDNNTLDIKIDN